MISAENDIQFHSDSFQHKPIISIKTQRKYLPQKFRHSISNWAFYMVQLLKWPLRKAKLKCFKITRSGPHRRTSSKGIDHRLTSKSVRGPACNDCKLQSSLGSNTRPRFSIICVIWYESWIIYILWEHFLRKCITNKPKRIVKILVDYFIEIIWAC